MDNIQVLFTLGQGNLLIRLILAHFIADFVLQTNTMVANKKWFSKQMFAHIGIVFLVTFVLSLSFKISLTIAVLHWIIDGLKCSLQNRYSKKESVLFFSDQLLHLLSIVALWALVQHISGVVIKAIILPFTHYHISLLLLAYTIVIWPVGYAMQFALQGIAKTNDAGKVTNENKLEHGGKLIGMFERLIILTLVLLNQYEAIGFLITGKSIIRFADHNSNLRSEYVLVGTMMSYAISILVGVLTNKMLIMAV